MEVAEEATDVNTPRDKWGGDRIQTSQGKYRIWDTRNEGVRRKLKIRLTNLSYKVVPPPLS